MGISTQVGFESQQGVIHPLTFPTPMRIRILPVTCPCFPCFLSCRMAAAQPLLPKTAWETYHSTKAMLLSQKDGRWMEALPLANWCRFHPCRRDEMAEQSKFLSSPLIYSKYCGGGEKLCPTPRACLPRIHSALLGTYWPWQCHRTSVCLKK